MTCYFEVAWLRALSFCAHVVYIHHCEHSPEHRLCAHTEEFVVLVALLVLAGLMALLATWAVRRVAPQVTGWLVPALVVWALARVRP